MRLLGLILMAVSAAVEVWRFAFQYALTNRIVWLFDLKDMGFLALFLMGFFACAMGGQRSREKKAGGSQDEPAEKNAQ